MVGEKRDGLHTNKLEFNIWQRYTPLFKGSPKGSYQNIVVLEPANKGRLHQAEYRDK